MKLLLFDIDHTLLASGGAGFRAMNRAFAELYGIEDATRGIVPDGKTDPMLFEEAVRNAQVTGSEEARAITELRDAGAHLVFDDLSDTSAVIAALGV